MKNLISAMIEEDFVRIKAKSTNKSKNYNGNLAELREKRARMLRKKHYLNLQIKKYNKMTSFARDSIFKNIEELSWEINAINIEIEKVHKAMQNSDKWMDGSYNSFDLS